MLSIPVRRIAPFIVVMLLAVGLPIVAIQLCEPGYGACKSFSGIIAAIFPFQLYVIIHFISVLMWFDEFWFSYSAYLIIVFLVMLKVMRQETPLVSKKNMLIFVGICAALYVVNEGIYLWALANFFRARPEEPVVPL